MFGKYIVFLYKIITINIISMSKSKALTSNIKTQKTQLNNLLDPKYLFEIGVDECARGPMFGRLYVSAVVLNSEFDHTKMCDSKKIHSISKMRLLSDYIKEHSTVWYIEYIEAVMIDEINIRQAVLLAMRRVIKKVLELLCEKYPEYISKIEKGIIMIDGNDFSEFSWNNMVIPHETFEKGDGRFSNIAAASILAKCAHDEYILDLCIKYPELNDKYDLTNNMGYGTKKHMEGIKKYGISQWHRRTFGCCKTAIVNAIVDDTIFEEKIYHH
jgi:ribonuclease HII